MGKCHSCEREEYLREHEREEAEMMKRIDESIAEGMRLADQLTAELFGKAVTAVTATRPKDSPPP
jgi:hypothetical protein